jgi:hypothetical protein
MAEPAVAAEICRRFDHVLVDEYEDTNRLRAEILLALRPDGSGLTVVGDDAQSIYSFRASAVRISSTFRAAFRRRPRSSRSNAIIDQRSRSSMPPSCAGQRTRAMRWRASGPSSFYPASARQPRATSSTGSRTRALPSRRSPGLRRLPPPYRGPGFCRMIEWLRDVGTPWNGQVGLVRDR